MTKEYNFHFVFFIAAILILIFALGVVWWAAILVCLLAALAATDFKITTTTRYVKNARYRKNISYGNKRR